MLFRSCAKAGPERRQQYLLEHEQRFRCWQSAEPLRYHPLEDYDETNQLRLAHDG